VRAARNTQTLPSAKMEAGLPSAIVSSFKPISTAFGYLRFDER
jgi:hypothetical protein